VKTYRFSTLLRLCGKPISGERYFAEAKRRNPALREEDGVNVDPSLMLTIHHGESSRDAFWGEPGGHCVNVAGRAIFPKPLPKDCGYVVGILQHAENGMF
jgi:hypothetical protein